MTQTHESITFSELFTDYKGRFIRFAQTYVRNSAVAEDIVTDSLVYYWEHRKRLDEDTNIPAYVLTVIKHKCLNFLQQQQIHKDIEENIQSHVEWELSTRIATLEACNPNELFNAEALEIVNRTIATLPLRTQQIFIMSRMQNMPHKEIAAKLDITTKGVEFHIGKALSALRVSLKDYLPVFFYLFFY